MKNIKTYLSIALISVSFFSCTTRVKAEDVVEQKEETQEAVADAEEELVKLAEVKEQYSEDVIKTEIEALRKKQKAIDSDIDKLKDLGTTDSKNATKSVLDDLKKRSKDIDSKVNQLESKPKENWESSIKMINSKIDSLEMQITKITKNVKVESK